MADEAIRHVKYQRDVPLAMQESKLTLERRVPSAERLTWAKKIAEKVSNRRPKGWPEVYALEQIELAAEPQRELKLQALRIGDVAIAAIPDEVFAITGLKLKLQSPLPNMFTIELANGAEGYIPPPEQHQLGGYTTWAARTAGLEVEAEPKIVETVLKLLEESTGKSRRRLPDPGGTYAAAVLKSNPVGYWRLAEISGNNAADASGNHHDAHYEDVVAHHLPGPTGKGMSADGQSSRSAHIVSGRVRADVPIKGHRYSVEFWFWNGLPNDARPVTGYLFSRGPIKESHGRGDHLGIGGKSGATGHLFFASGIKHDATLEGRATIEPKTWNNVILVRDGGRVRVYLNGRTKPEIDGVAASEPEAASTEYNFGGRPDGSSSLEGKLSEAAIYDRPITLAEVAVHYQAAGVPSGK
jgi:hypothetical protein